MPCIPGAKLRHVVIRVHGGTRDDGSFDEAVARLREEYDRALAEQANGDRRHFHVVLTVERIR